MTIALPFLKMAVCSTYTFSVAGMLGVSNTICSFTHSKASWAPKFEASRTSKLLARTKGSRSLLFYETTVHIYHILIITPDRHGSWTG